jgi:hypothetical protein
MLVVRIPLLGVAALMAAVVLGLTIDWGDPIARSSVLSTLALEVLVVATWDAIVRKEKKTFWNSPF